MITSILAWFVTIMFYVVTPAVFLVSLVLLIKQDWR